MVRRRHRLYPSPVKERVRITDVSPRDGLQNEAGIIPTAEKVRLVELLCATGVDEVEVTSFVSPKWVPQLGDAADVCAGIASDADTPLLSALVPNERGMEMLLEVNARRRLIGQVCLFTAASETFSKRNTNASIHESINRFRPVLRAAWARGLGVKLYVSCAFGCPFEGDISTRQVVNTVRACLAAASHSDVWGDQQHAPGFSSVEISLGDTIGAATRASVRTLVPAVGFNADAVLGFWAEQRNPSLTLHLHDTFGRAAECVHAALDLGVRSFDGSVAGLGGCPYASKKLPNGTIQSAPGNISTELLVKTIEDAGYATGVDHAKLAEAASFAREIVAKSRASASPERRV